MVNELGLPDTPVFAWDARGHGRNDGPRGFSPSIGSTIRDLEEFARHLQREHGVQIEEQVVIVQSVGAVLAASWVHDYAPRLRALILASPAFKVKLYVPFARPGLRLMHKLRGWYWLLLWPALSLILLAVGYASYGVKVWQKVDGQHRLPARCLLLHGHSHASLIADNVWIGRAIAARETRFNSVLDLAAEYCSQAHPAAFYVDLPLLDLRLPDQTGLQNAVAQLEALRRSRPGPILVHCALGMSRRDHGLAGDDGTLFRSGTGQTDITNPGTQDCAVSATMALAPYLLHPRSRS